MAELYMARTCKWGILRVVGGDVWNHSGDVLITPANNRLSGREGLDALIHAKAGAELMAQSYYHSFKLPMLDFIILIPCSVVQTGSLAILIDKKFFFIT